MRLVLAFILFGLAAPAAVVSAADAPQSQPSARAQRNLDDFDFVVKKITANYAGWDTKVTDKTRPQLEALTTKLRAKAATASDDELLSILQQWIGFFHDGHTGVSAVAVDSPASSSAAATKIVVPTLPWSEHYVEAKLAKLETSRDPIEGTWGIDEDQPWGARLAVMRDVRSASGFSGVVVRSKGGGWNVGEKRAAIERKKDGTYVAHLTLGDGRKVDFAGRVVADGDIFQVKDGEAWFRDWPKAHDPDKAERLFPSGRLFLKRLSPKTLWLRIPSFDESQYKPLKDLVAAHRKELESTPNLLIDLRNNGGGSDYVYGVLMPLLYTRPVISVGIQLRASTDNIALREAVAERIKKDVPDAAAQIEAQNKLMQQHLGEYVAPDPIPFGFDREDKVLPYPRRVAVLIDGAGSSAEQFLLDARQSHKVTLFGKRNSAGVLDFANIVSIPTPSGRYQVRWGTSRSLRVPDDPVDPDGIAPDIRIPSKVADPVLYAKDWLDRQVD